MWFVEVIKMIEFNHESQWKNVDEFITTFSAEAEGDLASTNLFHKTHLISCGIIVFFVGKIDFVISLFGLCLESLASPCGHGSAHVLWATHSSGHREPRKPRVRIK